MNNHSHNPFQLIDTLLNRVDSFEESKSNDEVIRMANETLENIFRQNEQQEQQSLQELFEVEMMMSGGMFMGGILPMPSQFQNENKVNQPLEKHILENLPVSVLTRKETQEKYTTDVYTCSICFEQVNEEKKEWMFLYSCPHLFHKNCILPWFEAHSTCPVCRQIVSLTSHLTE